ncbi:AUGMIN subunit 2-like isoform X2 [Curcuma longa]|uniref:AUGMIN subunit 2-like isoform X2 n=1 Tax=Curcuma longa TaxID=136217 RepID=UPI003D9E64CE
MAEAVAIASDLGFRVNPVQEGQRNLSNSICGDKGGDLIRVIRQLTAAQRNIANFQVELQGRKDRIIARLQQPYALDCIPVEAEYQKQFSELLLKAASDYGALTAACADFQWCQKRKEPSTVVGKCCVLSLLLWHHVPASLKPCLR